MQEFVLHTPTGLPEVRSQTPFPSPGKPVPATPQQSVLTRQRPPSVRQPDVGWQTKTPLAGSGAQSLLQHDAQSLKPAHTEPSMALPVQPDPLGGSPQVPEVLPAAKLHVPEQQSSA
jgi:hypothetical protein